MNILSYDEFNKVMTGIVSEIRFQDKIYNAVRGVGTDGEYFRNTPTVDTTLMLLNRIFKDDSEYPLIDYWVYELDCGDNWERGAITDDDGHDIPLGTISDLYDELTRQYANKEKE